MSRGELRPGGAARRRACVGAGIRGRTRPRSRDDVHGHRRMRRICSRRICRPGAGCGPVSNPATGALTDPGSRQAPGRQAMREVLRSCVACVWFILLPALAFGQTEVRVFVGGAVTEPVKEAGAAFARNSGSTLVYVTDTTGALQ